MIGGPARKTAAKGLLSAVLSLVAFALMLFLPAGTIHYYCTIHTTMKGTITVTP